jgi:hypothetical protein
MEKQTKSKTPHRPSAASFSTVRQIALSLENVEEVSSYRTPGFKVRGALFARFHQDGESLVVRMDIDKRDEMIAADPNTYYITDHYLNYPWILVRPSRIQPDALRGLLLSAHRSAAAAKRATKHHPSIPRRPAPRPKPRR